MIQPEDYTFATIVARFSAVTVRSGTTHPAAGTVRFDLITPRTLVVDGIEITPETEVGYIGEDGTLRRDNRSGEEGVLLLCVDPDFGMDALTYQATFDLTDGLGRGQIRRKPLRFNVTDNDIDLGGL
ncbi:MAG: hypothetical protein U5N53_28225 [Mycobacterium sp.]|nr:hypothetical protein [Mycobacterium sp.]